MWEPISQENSATYDIWLGRHQEGNLYLVEGYLKVQGGIRYLVKNYREQPTLPNVLSDLQSARFSRRPYRLGQSCDGSIDTCVAALFYDFCLSKGYNPIKLYRQAYRAQQGESYTDPNYREIIKQANWEGVEYPSRWDAEAKEGLLESLHEVNNHMLASIVDECVKSSQNKYS